MRIVGQEQIAAMFGVAPKTIVEWQEQGMPIAQRGGPGVASEYESADCIRWLCDRELKKAQAERPQDRLARAQAERIEMENAEKRGQLIPASLLEPKMRAAMIAAREAWIDSPPRIASDCVGRTHDEIEQILDGEFAQLLERLSRWSDAEPSDEEGRE